MADEIKHSTQYYIRNINRAILAKLHCRPLKLGRLIVLHEHSYGHKKFCSHAAISFPAPYPLDFNMLVIVSLKTIKRGHKLKLAYL